MVQVRAGDDADRSPPSTVNETTGTPSTAPTVPATPGAAAGTGHAAGTRLGRYVITAPIGAGGMGAVYAAHDPELDRKVAIKVLHDDVSEHATQRLRREARTMAQLSHPNLVAVHDVGVVGDQLFLTMELIEGTTLRAWVRDHPWRDVLAAYLAAGRGLAAAHAAGVVHRDFKPDNVLRSRHGRVAVGDFGIARRRDQLAAPGAAPTASTDVALTQTGAVLGTPIYMAPEQLAGDAADARSDQFAFAVALWEGLFHRHPLVERGAELAALRAAAAAGRVIDPPPGPVPARVTRALTRALRPDPAARWPSLDALLAALDVLQPRPFKALAILAAITVLAVGGAGYAWSTTRADRGPAPCGGSEALIAAIWSPARADATTAAFAASGVTYAADTWRHARDGIDRWTGRWIATRTAVCRATAVHHEQSPAVMDRKMRCLERTRLELAGLLDALAHPTPPIVENAAAAVSRLDDAGQCERATGDADLPPRSLPAAVIAGVVEPLLAAESSRLALGDVRTARAALTAMAPLVRASGDAAIQARHATLQGRVSLTLHELDRGRRELTRALHLADALGDDHARGEATLFLADLAYAADQVARARELSDDALAIGHRTGDDPHVIAEALTIRADVAADDDQLDLARADYQQAVTLLTGEGVAPGASLATTRANFAALLERVGDRDEAERQYRASVALSRTVLGAEHPKLAIVLGNLASLLLNDNRVDDALPLLEESLAIKRHHLGPDHPSLGFAYQNLGVVARRQGRLADAEQLFEHARVHFASSPDFAYALPAALTGLANLRAGLGRDREALPLYEQALALFVADHKDGTSRTADLRFRMAQSRWRLGDRAPARALALEARTFYQHAPDAAEPLADVEAWLADPARFTPTFLR